MAEINTKDCLKLLSFLCLFTLLSSTGFGQDTQMLLFEINGNHYKKCNYDGDGQLESYQIFNVGSIEQKGNIYNLPVEIINYNKNGIAQDTSKTLYTCDPADQNIFVNIFPYSDYGKGGEIKVKPEETNSLYPVNPDTGWQMTPIHFEMHINKGIVGFLGGKSKIKMFNRRVVPNDTLQTEQYQINSEVDISVYVMGFKMKEIGYRIIEIIDEHQGITWQKFNSNADDSYFVIRLL